MTNLANLDLLSPGSLAFKRLLNANWHNIDRACITEREYKDIYIFNATAPGMLLGYDSSGDLARALDSASADLGQKLPIGFAAVNVNWGAGDYIVRLMGVISGAFIIGSPSIGDTLYLSDLHEGYFSTTPGPNAVACGIFAGGIYPDQKVLFRPRLKVVS